VGVKGHGRDRSRAQPELQEQPEAGDNHAQETLTPVKKPRDQIRPLTKAPTRGDGVNNTSNDPFLSNAQPTDIEVDNAATDGLDFAILNSPIPSDTEDMDDDGNNANWE